MDAAAADLLGPGRADYPLVWPRLGVKLGHIAFGGGGGGGAGGASRSLYNYRGHPTAAFPPSPSDPLR